MGPCVRLSRVLALVGGLGLVAAFFMPWFGSQGLLLSGQFLHTFLSTAPPAQLRQFLPTSSQNDVQMLRLLVDLFPVCGAAAALLALLAPGTLVWTALLALSGLVPLLAWAGGITRLPPGASPEVGLALIAAGSIAVLLGALAEIVASRRPSRVATQPV